MSEHGIGKLKKLCKQHGAKTNAFVDDLTAYRFSKSNDLILSFATLCFMERNKWKEFLHRAKEYTSAGGIHIIQLFSDTVPASDDIAPFAVGLAKDGEIRECYSDWEIFQLKSYIFEDEHPNVPKHLHSANKIAARKIK